MAADIALIFGISGQDGAYLARLLLERGVAVHGTSRDREMASFANLHRLGIGERVHLHSAVPSDFRSVLQVISKVRPTRIFNLASQSSVGLSFDQPIETLDSIIGGTLNILEAIRTLALEARFYNASSSECFGNTEREPANEETPFRPRSPYGVGKAAAFWAVANYRESYDLFACSGVLFNHESPLRPMRYVTQKIVSGAADIAQGVAEHLSLGELDIARDWGWAPEYVEAMARMLEFDRPEDFVIATGRLSTLEDFVRQAFGYFGLDWRRYVAIDPELKRPSDIRVSVGNPTKAERLLGWHAETTMPALVDRLLDAEMARRRAEYPASGDRRAAAGG
ncbi:MAG TPA: GDP-mannose 4,6-dehydratase [Alphaproteobacteria bacterium]|nr:GDP-mannose 4,6-dehydratase [Alphaproteobacteria bacterium]